MNATVDVRGNVSDVTLKRASPVPSTITAAAAAAAAAGGVVGGRWNTRERWGKGDDGAGKAERK